MRYQEEVPSFKAGEKVLRGPSDCLLIESCEWLIEEKGIEKAIVEFCGLDLNEKDDRTVYELILGNYRELLESDVPVEVMKEKF